MVSTCVAYGCRKKHTAGEKISFHSFPFKRRDILQLWVKAIRRDDWYPSKLSKICSEHFTENDYITNPSGTKKLKPDAVPSIFDFTKHVPSHVSKRKILKEADVEIIKPIEVIEIDSDTTEYDTSVPTIQLNTKIKEPEPIKIVNMVDVGTQTKFTPQMRIDSQRAKIKILNQKLRRRNRQVAKLQSVVRQFSKGGFSKENFDAALKKYFQSIRRSYIISKSDDSVLTLKTPFSRKQILGMLRKK